MKLEDLIEQFDGKLTAVDRKLADVLVQAGPESAFLSAHEVSRRASVHPSGAVRFARKLGYDGYQDFQADLRDAALAGSSAVSRMKGQLETLSDGNTLTRVIEAEIRALTALSEQVAPQRLEDLARAVVKARRIGVFGIGHSAILSDLLALRLRRSGYDARQLHSLDWQAIDVLADFEPGDLLIAIVLRRTSNRFKELAAFLADRGIRLATLGDLGALAVRSPEALILSASRGDGEASRSVVIPLTLINALILEVSRLDEGRSIAALERREETRQQFKG